MSTQTAEVTIQNTASEAIEQFSTTAISNSLQRLARLIRTSQRNIFHESEELSKNLAEAATIFAARANRSLNMPMFYTWCHQELGLSPKVVRAYIFTHERFRGTLERDLQEFADYGIWVDIAKRSVPPRVKRSLANMYKKAIVLRQTFIGMEFRIKIHEYLVRKGHLPEKREVKHRAQISNSKYSCNISVFRGSKLAALRDIQDKLEVMVEEESAD